MTTVRIALAFLSLLFANSASAAREQHLCKEPAPVNVNRPELIGGCFV